MNKQPIPADNLLQVEQLTVALGGSDILHGVSFTSSPGVLGIWGANGSGKSTLLRTLAGILQPLYGTIHIAGHNLREQPVKARQHTGYVPEHAELYPYLSCRELAETVSALRGAPESDWREHIAPLGLQGMEDVRLGTLSAGQQRKVTMVLALCGRPTLLLLDEPTKALDTQARNYLDQIINAWKQENKLVVLTSHLPTYLTQHCTHFLCMAEGRTDGIQTELAIKE